MKFFPFQAQSEASEKILIQNSTTDPLGEGESFIGKWNKVELFGALVAACFSDQNGTMSVEFSSDGLHVDSTFLFKVIANVGQTQPMTITHPYCRVLFDNGSKAQNIFHLKTLVKGGHDLLFVKK